MPKKTKKGKINNNKKTRKLTHDNNIKNNLTNNNFKKLSCNPLVENNIHQNTCYNQKNINKLKYLWNLRHPDMLIEDNDPIEIWKFFKETFNDVCDNEQCWLKQEFSKNKIDKNVKNYIFAPRAPKSWNKNINEWLSNYDIMNVMSNYEKKYENFRFIGPSPINFDEIKNNKKCVWDELCNFNLSYYIDKNIDKIGFVFNTDPDYKSGEHWIAMFINLNPLNEEPFIFFFDSVGDKMPKEVEKLVNKILNMAKNKNLNLKFIENYNIQHQISNSECGMYCLYFILKLLHNKPTNYFLDKNNLITDKHVQDYRNKYFNII